MAMQIGEVSSFQGLNCTYAWDCTNVLCYQGVPWDLQLAGVEGQMDGKLCSSGKGLPLCTCTCSFGSTLDCGCMARGSCIKGSPFQMVPIRGVPLYTVSCNICGNIDMYIQTNCSHIE